MQLAGYQMYMFKFTNAYDYFIITFQLFSTSQSGILQCFEELRKNKELRSSNI